MSKKNKNKRRLLESSEASVAPVAVAAQVATPADDDLKREFKHLARTILFILALLIGLYYYDQQNHVLQTFTNSLMGTF